MAPDPPTTFEGVSASKQRGEGNARSLLFRISTRIHEGISEFFENLGRWVYRRPKAVIAGTALFAVLCTALFLGLFKQELDGEKLFTPDNSRAFEDQQYVEALYGEPDVETRVLVTRNVDVSRETDCMKYSLLADQDTGKSLLLEVFDLFDLIQDIRIDQDGQLLGLEDICVRPVKNGPCQTESILAAWDYNRTALETDLNVTATLSRDDITTSLGLPLNKDLVMGRNRNGGECNGNIEVYQFQFILQWEREDVNGEDIDPRTRRWLDKLVDVVRDGWNINTLEGFVSDLNSIDKESQKAIERDIAKLVFGYMLVIMYSHTVLFKNSPVFNKTHLAGFSVISVTMAMFTAFGLAQVFQVKFNLVIQTLPFLLLGLGMDDTFIIMGAYHNTNPRLPGEERVAKALRRAGSSILVTSLTDFVAFVMGIYTELPALRAFAVHACLGILFDFIYQVTFFVGFLSLDAKREKRALNGAPSWGYQCGCGPTEYDEGSYMMDIHPESGENTAVGRKYQCSHIQNQGDSAVTEARDGSSWSFIAGSHEWGTKIIGKGGYDPTAPPFSTRLVGNWLPKLTLHPVGKAFVILMEACLLAAAIFGITKVKMDFQGRDWFVPDSSWLKDAFQVEDMYFAGDSTRFAIYTKQPPPELPSYFYFQDEITSLSQSLRLNDRFVAENPPIRSWFEDFSTWLATPGTPHFNDTTTVETFDTWVADFISAQEGAFYRPSLIFDTSMEPPRIISSKFDAWSQDVVDGEFAVDLVDSLRNEAKASAPNLEPIAYSLIFLFYDGFRVIAWETIRNVIMAGSAVFLMSLIILADVYAAVLVFSMVAATDVMIFGWMHYVGLTFNAVTAINMVLAVGIAVDYSAHIAHSFLVVEGTRHERAGLALVHIGGEVLSGAFTTFLGVVVMATAEHYIFVVSFKMFFAIVLFGVWHGIVVLPVLLSLIGPKSYGDASLE